MRLHDFAYDLPPELIAQEPLPERSASRLLLLEPQADSAQSRARSQTAHADPPSAPPEEAALRDAAIRDLPDLLAPGDLLVLNDTRVVAARLVGAKRTGGRVEVFLERPLEGDEALVQLRASKPIRPGLAIDTAGGIVQVLGSREDLWKVSLPGPALGFFERWGDVPLPPYIRRPPSGTDRERYQSVFARAAGAVAAPTASLHFDAALLAALERRGIERAFITLHVGAGTFQPVRTQDLSAHVMHAERVSVSADTCAAIARARSRGGRVIAVGTTVVRALESAALESGATESAGLESAAPGLPDAPGPRDVPGPWAGETRLFITPGFRFRVIDGLLTNFHLPESTLL
ncbi:MAG: tRNA preQ1(34) S-adenosylmethionine ribosyltransferase-isomerase QueA, partial [Steroidobacteraceae bacterium]